MRLKTCDSGLKACGAVDKSMWCHSKSISSLKQILLSEQCLPSNQEEKILVDTPLYIKVSGDCVRDKEYEKTELHVITRRNRDIAMASLQ